MIKIKNLSSEIQNIKNQVNELERLKNSIPVIVVKKIDDYYINEKNGKKIDLSTLSDNTTIIFDDIYPAGQDESEVIKNEEIE